MAGLLAVLLAAVQAQALPAANVPAIACQDPNNAHAAVARGATMQTDLPAKLAAAFAFYADTQRPGASFAPAGWTCEIHIFPNIYDIEIVPQLSALVGLSDTPLWRQPMVAEQLLNANGPLPERLSFNALAVSLFPRLFPGGPGKWVGGPLRDAGHRVSDGEIGTLIPVGPQDVITRKSDRLVEFITPAGAQGLGTTGAGASFTPAVYPVYGVAGLVRLGADGPTMIEIFEFRLPDEMAAMRQPLIKLAEQQIAKAAAR